MVKKNGSFDKIYHQYYRLVMKIAKNVLKDYNLAQDICQEVFVTFYEKYGETKIEEEYIKPWLIVNTRRKAIDYCKKAYQVHETLDTGKMCHVYWNEGVSVSYDGDEMAGELSRRELTDEVMKNLKNYNSDWHKIIVRIVFEKRDPQKVARELGITIGNLRTKLHRAKAWIRKEYGDEYESL